MLIATFPSLRRRGNPTINVVVTCPELNQALKCGRPAYLLHNSALRLPPVLMLGQASSLMSHAPVIAEADKCAGGGVKVVHDLSASRRVILSVSYRPQAIRLPAWYPYRRSFNLPGRGGQLVMRF